MSRDDLDAPTTVLEPVMGDRGNGRLPETAPDPRKGGPGWGVTAALFVLAIAGIGLGAWGLNERSSLRSQLDTADGRVAELQDAGTSADAEASDLRAQARALEARNATLKKQLANAKEAAVDDAGDTAGSSDSTGEGDASAVGFSAGDEDILIGKTKASVKAAAGSTYSSCAAYSLVGVSDDANYAVTRADLATTACSPSVADPGEYMWHRTSSGAWQSVDADVHLPGDPSIDSMTICGAESSASAAVKAAISQICA